MRSCALPAATCHMWGQIYVDTASHLRYVQKHALKAGLEISSHCFPFLLTPIAPNRAGSLDPFLCILAAFPFLLPTGVYKFAFPIWSTKSFAIQGSP